METKAISRDDFEQWILIMDDEMEEFFETLPFELIKELNHSIESISLIESWILNKYENIQEVKKPSEFKIVDWLARYVGETFRRHIGGYWDIELKNKKNAYFNLPVITGYKNKSTPICIHSLITASVDRRSGDFMRTVLLNTLNG